jgi:hypothetical protein
MNDTACAAEYLYLPGTSIQWETVIQRSSDIRSFGGIDGFQRPLQKTRAPIH